MLVERTLGGLHAFLENVVRQRYGGAPVPSVLDLGCGSGAWLHRLRPAVQGVAVGVDYSQPAEVEGLDLRQFDINADPASVLGKYALVTCIEVIEHIENVGKLLDVICAATAASGFAVITTPNVESLRARIRAVVAGKLPSFDEKSDPTHLMPILEESLQKMLTPRGITIVETLQYPVDKSSSLQYRRSVQWLAWIGGFFLPDRNYGDTAVHIIQHKK